MLQAEPCFYLRRVYSYSRRPAAKQPTVRISGQDPAEPGIGAPQLASWGLVKGADGEWGG